MLPARYDDDDDDEYLWQLYVICGEFFCLIYEILVNLKGTVALGIRSVFI